ncbi:MAG: hypothetical protein MRY74_10765 [Neomegalonema sp.]|nr:hypothetical protein [Neomegalonema sp.]
MRSATLSLTTLTAIACGFVYTIGQISVDYAEQSKLREDVARRGEIVDRLKADRDRLQDRIARLTGPEIDVELLDEHLRRALGVGRADEVLLLPPKR